MSGPAPSAFSFLSGGLRVGVHDETGRHLKDLMQAVGVDPADPVSRGPCPARSVGELSLVLERPGAAPRDRGLRPVTRGAWTTEEGAVVFSSVGGSGFEQTWTVADDSLEVRSSWSPGLREAAASRLRTRFRALSGQVLVHYPVLWWAGVQGLAPLHASVVDIGGVGVLLAGPGGVGKSTLVAQELAAGHVATCDNLAVSDGLMAFGVREPLRLPSEVAGAGGERATHHRREQSWTGHVPGLRPDLVAVVRRGSDRPGVRVLARKEASRVLVAGTLAAGELQRYWAVQAVLGLATGRGPVVPETVQVATQLTSSLPCLEVDLGPSTGGPGLAELLDLSLGDDDLQGLAR